MSYYFNAILKDTTFEDAIKVVTDALDEQGFGILNKINIQEVLKKKLNVEFRKYIILGACNPTFAYKALLEAEKIGVFLPCNVVVEEHDNGDIEVAIVNPLEAMSSVRNIELEKLALDIRNKLLKVIKVLKEKTDSLAA